MIPPRAVLAIVLVLLAGPLLAQPPAYHPNLLVEVGAPFLSAVVERPSERVKPVCQCILKTAIRGTSYSQAFARLEMVPDPEHFSADLVVTGQSWTKTTGRQKPVCIYSDGQFRFEVRQRIWVSARGVAASYPWAIARGQSTLTDLKTDFKGCIDKLVRVVALKRYDRDKGLAQRIADGIAQREGAGDVAKETAPQWANLQTELEKGLLALEKEGVPRHNLRMATDAGGLAVTLQVGQDEKVVPPPPPGDGEVRVRVRDHALMGLINRRLAGKTFDDKGLEEQVREIIGRQVEVKAPPADKPWSVTLAGKEPVVVRFEESAIDVTVRIAELTSEDEIYPPADLHVRYRIRRTEKGFIAERDDDLKLYLPGTKRFGPRLAGMRSVIRKRLGPSLPPSAPMPDVPLSGDLARLGVLRPTTIDTRDGWLVVAWVRAPASVSVPAVPAEKKIEPGASP